MSNTQYFLIRRVHSLLGVLPLGIFLIAHMTTNSMAFFGPEAFIHKVELIHSLGPLLPFVEAAVIFIPLALHILIGVVVLRTGKGNTGELGYGRNWAYSFQRWTGWLAIAFLLYHTIGLRFMDVAASMHIPEGQHKFYVYLAYLFRAHDFWWFWILVYVVGGVAIIYHFANGLCTFCMTWGITVGPKSQQVMAYIAAAIGLALFSMLMASIIGFYLGWEPAFVPLTEYNALEMSSAAGG